MPEQDALRASGAGKRDRLRATPPLVIASPRTARARDLGGSLRRRALACAPEGRGGGGSA
jgi:hypothetical protein